MVQRLTSSLVSLQDGRRDAPAIGQPVLRRETLAELRLKVRQAERDTWKPLEYLLRVCLPIANSDESQGRLNYDIKARHVTSMRLKPLQSTPAIKVSGVSETKTIVKPAAVLMSGRVVAFAFTFVIPVVLARIFDPEQFGTYKQLFLIYGAVSAIAQLGMTSSLYYFLPSSGREAGHYVANSLAVVGAIGLGFLIVSAAIAPRIAVWLGNPELPAHIPLIGMYTFLMMLSGSLEIVLITEERFGWASASYGLSDLARAIGLILPALLFRQLHWLLVGAVCVASLRASFVVLFYFAKYRNGFRVNLISLGRQWSYSLPFGMAGLIEVFQGTLPQYLVSYSFDPATFAVFAVGCLEIPIVEFVAGSTGDVLMVKMQQGLAAGDVREVIEFWKDTTAKLAVLMFPLVALIVVAGREIIVLIYTDKYLASVPIFLVLSTLTLLVPMQVDALLRVLAQTRYLFILNLARLALLATLGMWALHRGGLVGLSIAVVIAAVVCRAAAIARVVALLETGILQVLPWRRLGTLLAAAMVAAGVALSLKSQIHDVDAILLLPVLAIACGFTYAALVWRMNLLSQSETLIVRQLFAKCLPAKP
jgi:O-antigen/teichoic acid export membrane protein